jgi:hypothetical protein
VAEQAGDEAAGAGAGELLVEVEEGGAVAGAAAELLGEAHAEQAELTCPKVQVARELGGLLPGVDVGHELAVDEAAQGVTEGGALVVRDRGGRHASGRLSPPGGARTRERGGCTNAATGSRRRKLGVVEAREERRPRAV